MTITIIISLTSLLLVAYVFDITSRHTRIPSVILLLLLGWLVSHLAEVIGISLPDMNMVLPVLGTIGLILIVLEGSLELELNRSRMGMIRRSFFGAFFPIIIISLTLAFYFQYLTGADYKDSLAYAIPFSVISSAVAISSAKNLNKDDHDFIVYESSMSDITGVLFFNFIVLNSVIDVSSVIGFLGQVVMIGAISMLATMFLSYLLGKIEHPIKFAPVILLVILIYAVSEIYHLPALVFILLFGLFLGNLDELAHLRWIRALNPSQLNREVHKMKDIITEATFLVRSLFFMLFGFLVKTEDIINLQTLVWAAVIVVLIFIVRVIQLKLSGMAVFPLVFMAPRGLINILLFLSVLKVKSIPQLSSSLMIQVIILSALVMMVGTIISGKKTSSIDTEKEITV